MRIDPIPITTTAKLNMFVRFKVLHCDGSIALFTEGLGQRRFHGRVALLVNEHTKSAAEMIADFRKHQSTGYARRHSNGAGEVLGAVSFLVAEGYRLRIPVGGWMAWNDRLLESTGAAHSFRVPRPAPRRSSTDFWPGRSTWIRLFSCHESVLIRRRRVLNSATRISGGPPQEKEPAQPF